MFKKLLNKMRKRNRSLNDGEIPNVEQLRPVGRVNSVDVIAKVEHLRPELDKLVRQAYEEEVRHDIEMIKAGPSVYVDYFRSFQEKSPFKYKLPEDKVEAVALKCYDDLKRKHVGYMNACPMSPEDEQAYIERYAYDDMHRFGACHGIWNTKKRILKEQYGIEWYTPDEEHPDIIFD